MQCWFSHGSINRGAVVWGFMASTLPRRIVGVPSYYALSQS
ncbi:hypothetical protein ISN44_As03g032420 [Arabidopsis suecica]|uniref:Uncharacterized protein n=1 Tax=Arabidopsis suecica TaxID=45249 RepID=A0A8T2FB11_ARASU|nr:hypothetical protein ISN44_As03g032420 [Arabidopsis suecica]